MDKCSPDHNHSSLAPWTGLLHTLLSCPSYPLSHCSQSDLCKNASCPNFSMTPCCPKINSTILLMAYSTYFCSRELSPRISHTALLSVPHLPSPLCYLLLLPTFYSQLEKTTTTTLLGEVIFGPLPSGSEHVTSLHVLIMPISFLTSVVICCYPISFMGVGSRK